MIRRLKPKGRSRNNDAACRAAFEAITNVRSGRPRMLRKAVPIERRVEAGTMLLTLRDLGYDDDQVCTSSSSRAPGPLDPHGTLRRWGDGGELRRRPTTDQRHVTCHPLSPLHRSSPSLPPSTPHLPMLMLAQRPVALTVAEVRPSPLAAG